MTDTEQLDAAWQAYRDSSPGAISPEMAYRAGWVAAQKVVDGRCANAARVLEEMLSRGGGPHWIQAKALVRSDVGLALLYLREATP